jgi:hypothetical protein
MESRYSPAARTFTIMWRLIRPMLQDGRPCQLFNTLKIPKFEVAKTILIVSVEINVDLLGCGSKPM